MLKENSVDSRPGPGAVLLKNNTNKKNLCMCCSVVVSMVEALSFWLLTGFLQCSPLLGKEAVVTHALFFHGLRSRASLCVLRLVCVNS